MRTSENRTTEIHMSQGLLPSDEQYGGVISKYNVPDLSVDLSCIEKYFNWFIKDFSISSTTTV